MRFDGNESTLDTATKTETTLILHFWKGPGTDAMALRFGFEYWPYEIAELVMSDFKLLPDFDTMTCQ